MLVRETPVARAMLRCELRSPSSAFTWLSCTALAVAAGTNRAW